MSTARCDELGRCPFGRVIHRWVRASLASLWSLPQLTTRKRELVAHARRQHPNAVLTPAGRRRMVSCVLDRRWTIEATAERFQVDAQTVRKWRDRLSPKAMVVCWTGQAVRVDHPTEARVGIVAVTCSCGTTSPLVRGTPRRLSAPLLHRPHVSAGLTTGGDCRASALLQAESMHDGARSPVRYRAQQHAFEISPGAQRREQGQDAGSRGPAGSGCGHGDRHST